MSRIKDIFEHTDCVSEEMLTKYISGKLSPAEKHTVEKHLIDCEMCSDTVEGLSMIASPQPSPTLLRQSASRRREEREQKIHSVVSELNKKIQNRVEKKEVKIIFHQQYRTQLAVAASIILVVGLVWFFKSNVSLKDASPASSEKIFADKFIPPSSDLNEASPAGKTPSVPDAALVSEKKQPVKPRPRNTEPEAAGQNAEAKQNKEDELKQPPSPSALNSGTTSAGGAPSAAALPSQSKTSVYALQGDEESAGEKNRTEENSSTKNQTVDEEALVSEPLSLSAAEPAPAGKEEEKNTERKASKARRPVPAGYNDIQTGAEPSAPEAQPENKNRSGSVDDPDRKEPPAFDSAMAAYGRQEYAEAIKNFERALKQNPGDEKSLFYSAVSYLSVGQAEKAIMNLGKILANKNSKYFDDAQWYSSLAYIKQNDMQNARFRLTEIQKSEKSKYKKQAEETLKEMNK